MKLVGVLALLVALPAAAEETLILRESSIKAMEGLPTVTFVVPWQQSQPGEFIAMPHDSILDDYLLPLDSALLPLHARQPGENTTDAR